MPLTVNEAAFESCHENFLAYMQEKANGEAFTNFQHPFLVDDEVSYKWTAYRNGRDALSLDKWHRWKAGDGRTIQAVKDACLLPGVGANWLEHRFGAKGNSDAPLYRVEGRVQIKELEEQLHTLMIGGSDSPNAFARRFDMFADYLRNRHLSLQVAVPIALGIPASAYNLFSCKARSIQQSACLLRSTRQGCRAC